MGTDLRGGESDMAVLGGSVGCGRAGPSQPDAPGKMGQDGGPDGDDSALVLENNFLLCVSLPATVTAACKKAQSQPITRSNYLPSASCWQRPPRLLPKRRFPNTLIQKAPRRQEKALPAQTSCKVSSPPGQATGVQLSPWSPWASASAPGKVMAPAPWDCGRK